MRAKQRPRKVTWGPGLTLGAMGPQPEWWAPPRAVHTGLRATPDRLFCFCECGEQWVWNSKLTPEF